MKAIEIMFNEIDRLNEEIKSESNISQKISKALEINQVIRIIKEMKNLQLEEYLPLGDRDYNKEYI